MGDHPPHAFAYLAPSEVASMGCKERPIWKRILCAGDWSFHGLPGHGALAVWPGASRRLEAYGDPVDCGDGLMFLPPKGEASIYDYADCDKAKRPGVDVHLACGYVVTIPVATRSHVRFALGKVGQSRSPLLTEYGQLACKAMDAFASAEGDGIPDEDMARLVELAFAGRYRMTKDMLDHLDILTQEDVSDILGAIWTGDPKALRPESGGPESNSES